MTKHRTKKSPTSSSGKSTDVRPQVATPKGTAASVAPSLEERVAALERAVMTLAVHLPAALWEAQDVADAKTKSVLSELERLFSVAGTLARLQLPEEAYDDAFEEWERLPSETEARWTEANRRLGERYVSLGLMDAEEVRIAVPVVTIDADAVHRTRGLMPKER